MTKFNKGFTLIELLVVISIIGLLSSVVLASLSTARNKAKDSALIQMAKQLQTIMIMRYSDIGSYSGVQPNWIIGTRSGAYTVCESTYLNLVVLEHRPKVTEICNRIAELTPQTGNRLYMGQVSASADSASSPPILLVEPFVAKSFTIKVLLNSGTSQYYCIGHNGKSSIGRWDDGVNGWDKPGCYGDITNK
jgi:prepilin-type N-terminal cleavage/methylation domain-containing protein